MIQDCNNYYMRFVRYYKAGVLAMFQSQSEKYDICIDEFEGKVQLTDRFYREARERNERCWLSVEFGFRACKNGEWAVAAYRPDLENASFEEQQPWSGFLLEDGAFPDEQDERFKKWVDRYIMGSWDVPEGPFASLHRVASQINAVCQCVVGTPLFNAPNFRKLCFPLAENDHRYQDAHSEVYKLAIDGLSKEAIERLGDKLGILVKPGDKTTVNALEKLFPTGSVRDAIRKPLDQVSAQRRLSDHKARPGSHSFPAFEEFGKDMRALVEALELLRDDIAQRLDANVARCEERASAMRGLPDFDKQRPPQPNYGVFPAFQMQGKQVVGVHAGELVAKPGRSKSEEALLLEFADGSLVSIEAATNNLSDILGSGEPINPEDVNIRLYVNYVPPMLPFAAEDEGRSVVEAVE